MCPNRACRGERTGAHWWAVGRPRRTVAEVADQEHIQNLMRLVETLERDAKRTARRCGALELKTLAITAEKYLVLYRDLKARGEIE